MQFAVALILSVIFWPGIMGAATTTRWAFLSILVPVLVWNLRIEKITAAHLFGGLYLIWAGITLAWSPSIYDGLNGLWKFLLLAGLFCWAAQQTDLKYFYMGLGFGVFVNFCFMVPQAFGWTGLQQNSAPGGLFLSGNIVAEFAALTLIGLIGYRLWWLVPFPITAISITSSRGSVIALAAAFVGWLWTKSRIVSALLALAIAGLGVSMLTCTSDCLGHGDTGPQRLRVWADTARLLTWHGTGIGQYAMAYAEGFMFENAHNDLLQIASETGIGVLFFCAFLIAVMMGVELTERLILVAFMVEGLVAYPLYLPGTGFIAAIVAGRLCRDRADIRDNLACWRIRILDRQYRTKRESLRTPVPCG